jgi:hypothetical protein
LAQPKQPWEALASKSKVFNRDIIASQIPKGLKASLMGNQRQIIQVSPRKGPGVVIAVRIRHEPELRKLAGDANKLQHFYCILFEAGEAIHFPNLDGPDTSLGPMPSVCLAIQSGGKMWCRYEAFVEFLNSLAPLLEDARFFIGDELDYIDEYRITEGKLECNRVHQGGWRPLDEFINRLKVT